MANQRRTSRHRRTVGATLGLALASVFLITTQATARRLASRSPQVRSSKVRPRTPSFPDFDRRARAGARLNVVFFGASLTWGANASNPSETSYRAETARRFEAAYPRAHFRFFDAAIGGTGSQLGVFRLQRDVLSRKPDLVFLDFSANDDIYSDDAETLSSYESLVRRLVIAKVPVVQVIFPFQWNIKPGEMAKMKRRDAHRNIARLYNTGVGDAIELATRRVQKKQVAIETLWPLDGVHPGDAGYRMFADAAFEGYRQAVRDKRVCRVRAAMVGRETYMTPVRARISQLGPLPQGWRVGIPNRTSAYYDFLMSRWLDDEVIASNRGYIPDGGRPEEVPIRVASLKFGFRGEMVMLLGEATLKTGRYRALIDGELVKRFVSETKPPLTDYDPGAFAEAINGNGHHVQVIATGLNPNIAHTLEIEPVLDSDTQLELRFESVCVSGAGVGKSDIWMLRDGTSLPVK